MPLLDATGLIADTGPVPVPLAELGDQTAMTVSNTVAISDVAPLFDQLTLIAVEFPAFSDGRGFSVACALREAGYRGRLRALGQLIPDQFGFALDCGFDEVEIDEARLARQPVAQWLAAAAAISVSYQPDGRHGASIFERRTAARGSA